MTNLSSRFQRAARGLIERVGVPAELWLEAYVEATSTTSAGYDNPKCYWSGKARLEAYTGSRSPQVEATVQGKIPEWIGILSTEAFCNLPSNSRWWLMIGGQRYNPTHPEAADMAAGGIVEIGLKGGR
jgi:hypothetical protein